MSSAYQEAEQGETVEGPTAHSVDLRLTVPTFSGRYYINVLMGPEQRNDDRLASDREHHPVGTWGNRTFLFVAGAAFGLGGVIMAFDGLMVVLQWLGLASGS